MNPDSEQILDRFVQSELSLEEENDFLAYCEIDQERYRRVVLALVEHRRLENAFASLGDLQVDSLAEAGSAVVSSGEFAKQSRVAWIGLAVAAMFAGILIGRGVIKSPEKAGSGSEQIVVNEPPSKDTAFDLQTPELEVPLPQDGSVLAERSPQVQSPERFSPAESGQPQHRIVNAIAKLLDQERSRPLFTDDARERLRQGGWEVEEEPRVYLFSTQDGQQFAVPTKNANIRFVKQ